MLKVLKSSFLFLSLYLGLNSHCLALAIPKFELPLGSSVTISNDYEKQRRIRESKDKQQTLSESSLWVRKLFHVARDKRIGSGDEWILWVPLDKSRSDANQAFESETLEGLQARYYLDGEMLVVAPVSEGDLLEISPEQRKRVESIARGNSYFESITELASIYDYSPGVEHKLTAEAIDRFLSGQDSATIKMNAQKYMWERDIAEFEVRTSTNSNREHCTYFFWVLADSGRPVQLSLECKLKFKKDGLSYYAYTYLSRAYSYDDMPISTIAPEPLPALQPNGDILGMEFSDKTGQLAILTREPGSKQSWLSFWDLHQRKALISIKQAGKRLSMTDDQNGFYVFDEETRIINSQRLIGNSYRPFGQVVNPDFEYDRAVKSSSLIGLYPISINQQNEFELWNPGYNKISFRKKFVHSKPEFISAARDGRLVTADAMGNFYLHHITVDVSKCNTDIESSFCDHPAVHFQESGEVLYTAPEFLEDLSPAVSVTLGKIELHPDKTILKYCTQSPPVTCGIIDYSAGRHWPVASGNVHFTGWDRVIADHGSYAINGESFVAFDIESSYVPGSALSEKHHLLFNYQPYFDVNRRGQEIHIRSSDSGEILDTIARQTYPVLDIGSSDENTLLFLSGNPNGRQVYQLDLVKLELRQLLFEGRLKNIKSNDEFLMLVGQTSATIVRKENHAIITTLDFPIKNIVLLEEYLVYSRGDSIYQLSLKDKSTKKLYTFDSPVHEFIVLDDTGMQLVARLNHGVFTLPHLDKNLELPYRGSGQQALVFDSHTKVFFVSGLYGYSNSFNPDIEVIQGFSLDGEPVVEMFPRWGETQGMTVTSNGELWSSINDGDLLIRDIKSGLILEEFSAHRANITKIYQLDENIVVTGASDGTMKLWRLDIPRGKYRNAEQGVLYDTFVRDDIGKRNPKLLSTIVADTQGEILISSPDGYYWSTPRAIHQASFLNGDELFDFSRYDYWLNRPDIILERLGKGSTGSRKLWKKMVEFRQSRQPGNPRMMPVNTAPPELSVVGPDQIVNSQAIKIAYSTNLQQATRGRLHVRVNEVPIFGHAGTAVDRSSGELKLELIPGINRIKMYVETDRGVQSDTQYLTYNRPELGVKPDLYLLTIGVSDYEDDALDLNYASKDATDIKSLMADSTRYRQVFTETLLDKQVRTAAIMKTKKFLERSKPTDHVIVFFAGHGFLDEEDNYYFGTVDVDSARPEKRGLAYEEITNLLDGIPALNKLLMLDTCHSGEVTRAAKNITLVEGVSARGIKLKKSPRKGADLNLSFEMLQNAFTDLRASTGATVISAAGGQEFALETNEIKNGVFTASVIKALGEMAADSNGDGSISTTELREYTYREVSRLTRGQQKPTTRSYNLDFDFTVY